MSEMKVAPQRKREMWSGHFFLEIAERLPALKIKQSL